VVNLPVFYLYNSSLSCAIVLANLFLIKISTNRTHHREKTNISQSTPSTTNLNYSQADGHFQHPAPLSLYPVYSVPILLEKAHFADSSFMIVVALGFVIFAPVQALAKHKAKMPVNQFTT
jgi:hypothetical protein